VEIRFGKPIEYRYLLDDKIDLRGIAQRLQSEVQKIAQEME
jgi:hypothetical protein